jgi:hypothetical protein
VVLIQTAMSKAIYLAKDDYSVNNLGVEVGAVYKFKSFQIAFALPTSQENGNYRGIAAYSL